MDTHSYFKRAFMLKTVKLGFLSKPETSAVPRIARFPTPDPKTEPVHFISISAMPTYASKSVEELRFEHYYQAAPASSLLLTLPVHMSAS